MPIPVDTFGLMRNFRDMAENYQESAIELIQCKKEIEMCKQVQELNFEKGKFQFKFKKCYTMFS